MEVKEFVEAVRDQIGGEEFTAIAKMAQDGKMGFGPCPNNYGTTDGKGRLAVCIAWVRGSNGTLSNVEQDDIDEDPDLPGVDFNRPDDTAEIIQQFGKLFDNKPGVYCEWAAKNGAEIVAEIASRA